VNFLNAEFRTVPGLKLIPYNRLESGWNSNFADEILFKDGFGVAMISSNEVQAVEIDEVSALLLFVMQQSGVLPDFVIEEGDHRAQLRVFDLIHAGVLELKLNGKHYTKNSALQLLRDKDRVPPNSNLRENGSCNRLKLCQLSLNAVTSAIDSNESDVQVIQGILYRSNTIPISRKLKIQFEDGAYEFSNLISKHFWTEASSDGWFHYYPSHRGSREFDYQAKMYVSPSPADFTKTLRIVADVFSEHDGVSFKIGSGIAGLVRPDKIVAYFTDKDTLIEVVQKAIPKLQHITAQGVPFTAQCTSDGLLSWGVDPHCNNEQGETERKSWRQWVVEKIAESLASMDHTYRNLSTSEIINIILDRLELEGVDLNSFGPNSSWIRAHQLT